MTGAPTADHIARAIVAASRETGADPLAVAGGELDPRIKDPARPAPVSRARAYAGKALAEVFPDEARPLIAKMVGASKASAGSYFSALEQRLVSTIRWWDWAVLARVVAAIDPGRPVPSVMALSERMVALRDLASNEKDDGPPASEPAPFKNGDLPPHDYHKLGKPEWKPGAQLKLGSLPAHDPRKLGTPESPVTRLKRVLSDFGPPRRTEVEQGLERRAVERVQCRDLLAEAARNTAALPIPKEPDES